MRQQISFLALALLCLFSKSLQAQFVLTTEQPEDIEVCKEGELLDIKMVATESFSGALSLELELPAGITAVLESGLVTNTAATLISSNYSDPGRPSFILETTTVLSPGQAIEFQLKRKGECAAIQVFQEGGIFEDILRLSFDGGEVEDFGSSYELLYGALSIVVPEPHYFAAGVVDTQMVEIANGGLACVENFLYQQTNPDNNIEILSVWLNDLELSFDLDEEYLTVPITSEQLTLAGFPACFPAGSSLQLDLVKLAPACTPAIDIDYVDLVDWGCSGQVCNTAQPQVSSILATDQDLYEKDLIVDWIVEPIDDCGYMQHTINLIDPSVPSNANIEILNFRLGYHIEGWNSNIKPYEQQSLAIDSLRINEVAASFESFNPHTVELAEEMGFLPTDTGYLMMQDSVYQIKFQTGVLYGEYPLRNQFSGCPKLIMRYQFECTEEQASIYEAVDSGCVDREYTDHHHENPSPISEETGFDFYFDLEFTSDRSCDSSYMAIAFDFPPGFNLNHDAITGSQENGNLLYASLDAEGLQMALPIDTNTYNNTHIFGTVDCSVSGNWVGDIPYELRLYCGENCNYDVVTRDSIRQVVFCEPEVIGPGTGPCFDSWVNRKSFGWTDYTMTERVDIDSEDDIATRTAAAGDTLEVQVLFSGACLLDSQIRLSHNGLSDEQPAIRPLSATLSDNQGIELLVIDSSQIELGMDSVDIFFLNTMKLDLNEILLDTGQSYRLNILCQVVDNHPAARHDLSPFLISFGIDETEQSIGSLSKFHTLGYDLGFEELAGVGESACGRAEILYRWYWDYDGNYDHFPFEYRPVGRFDTLTIDLPLGMHSPVLSSDDWQIEDLLFQQDSLIFDEFVRYQFYEFENYVVSDLALDSIDQERNEWLLRMEWTVDCPGTNQITSGYSYKKDLFDSSSAMFQQQQYEFSLHTYYSLGQNSQLIGNPSLQALEYQFELPIISCDVFASFDQQTTFFRFFDDEESLIDFDPDDLYPELDDGSKIVSMGTQALLDCAEDFSLEFVYNGCDLGTQSLFFGYSCESEITNLSQICEMVEHLIEVDPKKAEVQLETTEPQGPQLLCSTIDYSFTIASARQAAILNPRLQIDLPNQGLSIVDTAWLEYPLGSDWRAFVFDSSDESNIVFDLASIDLETGGSGQIAQRGMPGVFNSEEPERQAKIHLQVTADCQFVSGSQARVTVYADRVCGEPAIGNGITELLQPLWIEGALPYSSAVATVEQRSVDYCEETAIVDAQIVFQEHSPVSVGEKCSIRLPKGALLLEQSLVYPQDQIVNWSTQLIGDQQELHLYTSNDIASGDLLEIEFAVDLSEHFCDGTETEYFIQSTEQLEVLCQSSNSLCDLSVKNSLGSGFHEAILQRFEPQMTGNAEANCSDGQTAVALDLDLAQYNLEISGTDQFALSVYLDRNSNEIVDPEDLLIDQLQLTDYTIVNTEISIVEELFLELLDAQLLLRLESLDENNCALHCDNLTWPLTVDFANQYLISGQVWLDSNGDAVENEPDAELPVFQGTVSISQEGEILGTAEVLAGSYEFVVPGVGHYEVEILEGEFIDLSGAAIHTELIHTPNQHYFDGSCSSLRSFDLPLEVACLLDVLDYQHTCIDEGQNVEYNVLFGQFASPLTVLVNGEQAGSQLEGAVTITVPAQEPFAIQVIDGFGCIFTLASMIDCVSLPIELLTFEALALERHNLVRWQVASEEDIEAYRLERSKDGVDFTLMTDIPAQQQQSTMAYEQNDIDFHTLSYYRLSTISTDGEMKQQALTSVSRTNDNAIDAILLEGSLQIKSEIDSEVWLYDLNGRLLIQEAITIGRREIDLGFLSAGVYLMRIAGQTGTQKILITQ